MSRVLLIEEDSTEYNRMMEALASTGHEVSGARTGQAALDSIHRSIFDVVVEKVGMREPESREIFHAIKEKNPPTRVILVSDVACVSEAVELMKIGADDFLQKPLSMDMLEIKVRQALNNRSLSNEVDFLRHGSGLIYQFNDITGKCPQMQKIFSVLKKITRSNATVLITGETGTGKELIAGAIHYNSERRNRPFVSVNCAALQETLLESELFGHERGAFTGAVKQRSGRLEQANTGTIFLDEIGDMSLRIQAKVLRVLQERRFERLGGNKTIQVDLRILAATNKNLIEEIENGRFREELYFRINVIHIELPPLRERGGDIELLATYFLDKFRRSLNRNIRGFSPRALAAIHEYPWPGNVRELRNVIERAVLMAQGDVLEEEDLLLEGGLTQIASHTKNTGFSRMPLNCSGSAKGSSTIRSRNTASSIRDG
ncbi:MAG: sigma-54-dependent Fis family transcriptional regulator [Deltaproteobacteria bacterium]|nr:sigma-54-dependent Fis family transcriptional regulator [Deltaproteobacteria bacterium]